LHRWWHLECCLEHARPLAHPISVDAPTVLPCRRRIIASASALEARSQRDHASRGNPEALSATWVTFRSQTHLARTKPAWHGIDEPNNDPHPQAVPPTLTRILSLVDLKNHPGQPTRKLGKKQRQSISRFP
jgi:hypothetical protein